MSISSEEVSHIAHLARLELSHDEVPRYAEQLSKILDYVEQLKQLNTEGVEPTSHALDVNNVFREDVVQHRLTEQQVFQNAPEREDHYFKVPQIMEDKR